MTGATACRWDGNLIPADDAVLVGATERGSGPPLLIYACTACLGVHDLLPLTEHPADSDGTPRSRGGQLVVGTDRMVRR